MIHYERIPQELRDLPQWVCANNGSKIPMQIFFPKAASSTDPNSWGYYSQALKAVKQGVYDYIGFVFNNNGYVGIDIDDGYTDGLMSNIAVDIINHCKSYTERSRSGRGFHIILKGDLPFLGKNNLKGVEIYKASRYFIMTGDTFVYEAIIESQEAIDYVVNKYFPEARAEKERGARRNIYEPVWELGDGGKIPIKPKYPEIPDGTRNICLTSLAGKLYKQGRTKEEVLTELFTCNDQACKPPLEIGEVEAIVNSVFRYRRY